MAKSSTKPTRGFAPRPLEELAAQADDRHKRNYLKKRIREESVEALAALYAARQERDDAAEDQALRALADLVPLLLNATCTASQWEKLRATLPRDEGAQLSLLT